jgi:MFS family permease
MTQAVTLNSILFAGLGIGAILSGIIADLWRRRKPLLVIGSLGGSCCVAFILFAPAGSYLGAIITLFITGLLLGTSVIVFTSVCETLPKGYSAAAIGIVNAVGCLAGGLLQFIPSLFVDGSRIQALSVYQKTLTIFLLVMIAATVAAFLLHETRPGWENAVTPDNDRLDPLPDTANADA